MATRSAYNAVMRQGADLVARLFAGQGSPITHMGVGTNASPESDSYDTAGLTTQGLAGETSAPISPEAFVITPDAERRVMRVRVRATLPPAAAVTTGEDGGSIREAGLLSQSEDGTVLYNRVTFDPISKGDDHELTLFWEVTFPYGDLTFM